MSGAKDTFLKIVLDMALTVWAALIMTLYFFWVIHE